MKFNNNKLHISNSKICLGEVIILTAALISLNNNDTGPNSIYYLKKVLM